MAFGRAPRAVRFLILGILLLWLLGPLPLPPRGGGQALAQETVRVLKEEAVGRYPEEIRFSFEAEADAEVVGVTLAYQVEGSPYTTVTEPEFTPGRRIQVEYVLDTQIHFFPPGTIFSYYWRLELADGRTWEGETQTFVYHDQRFDWKEVGDEEIRIFWYRGDREFGQEMYRVARRALDRLAEELGARPRRQIRIYVYGSYDDLETALPPNSQEWIGGQARPASALVVTAIWPSSRADREMRRILPHEITHLVNYQVSRNPYNSLPTWLEEGLAVYFQEVDDPTDETVLQEAIDEDRLIPLRALVGSFPADPDRAYLSYAESGSFVRFLMETYGSDKVGELVRIYRKGVTHAEALDAVFGKTIDELEVEWRAWLGASLPGGPPALLPREGTPEVRPTEAPSGPEPTPTPAGAAGAPAEETGALILFLGVLALCSCSLLLIFGALLLLILLRRQNRPSE